MRFVYVMDPMCAWCYGFQPELEAFMDKHASLEVDWIMGGLAPDSHLPMGEPLKQSIASYWYEIEKTTQVTFNHDYWMLNTPYRSTYPACRAVISADSLRSQGAQQMVKAIQSAYYLDAKNPSLEETLVACAGSMGLERESFLDVFHSEETEQRFQQHLHLTQQLQVGGFPALFFCDDRNQIYTLARGFCQAAILEQQFQSIEGGKRVDSVE
jgi:putative protein-disulfide isomerase